MWLNGPLDALKSDGAEHAFNAIGKTILQTVCT
jgi:hypothetical protein